MATTVGRFVLPVDAAVGAALCESAPTKRRACEPPRRGRFDGLATRRGSYGDDRKAVRFARSSGCRCNAL